MALNLIYTQNYDHMSKVAADILLSDMHQRTIAEKKDFNLGLATGNSPVGLYSGLSQNQEHFDALKISTFNLDEYVGLPGNNLEERAAHQESYTRFMKENLFDKLNPKLGWTFMPPATWIDQLALDRFLEETPGIIYEGADKGKAIVIPDDCENNYLSTIKRLMQNYINLIEDADGIDTWVVGVGGKGHIGFHESGIPLNHDILLVKLDENTIQNAVADGHFKTYEESPKYAISMGANGICRLSKNILLLASGERKAVPIARSLLEDTTSEVPISILQQFAKQEGKNATYIIDSAAAAGLEGKFYELRKKGIIVEDLRYF